jgi:hypothetical protein
MPSMMWTWITWNAEEGKQNDEKEKGDEEEAQDEALYRTETSRE